MYTYIAYRNLKDHFFQNSCCGGTPVNNDYRLTLVKDGNRHLLTLGSLNYAVTKESGDKFIEDVLSKCTAEHKGFFPLIQSLNGKETAAVIEMTREVDMGTTTMQQYFYYDMDDEVLLQMLDNLRAKSGEPLSSRELMNYCYPNAVLPEEDFELQSIYHGIYCKPENRPISVIQTFLPDKKKSRFWIRNNGLSVEIRDGDNEITYDVPSELLPEIKNKVRELCSKPAEAYVEHGEWEAYIKFGKDEKRIFTDPENTMKLLEEIASKGELQSTETVDTNKYYPVGKISLGTGFTGLGMIGFMGNRT